MNNNLDSSWKYTTKVNISPIELVGRNNAYRDGAADFQSRLIEEFTKTMEREYGFDELIEVVKKLKP